VDLKEKMRRQRERKEKEKIIQIFRKVTGKEVRTVYKA